MENKRKISNLLIALFIIMVFIIIFSLIYIVEINNKKQEQRRIQEIIESSGQTQEDSNFEKENESNTNLDYQYR